MKNLKIFGKNVCLEIGRVAPNNKLEISYISLSLKFVTPKNK